jgi:polyhydroxyalkanoate synthesis repressor PhaR
MIRVIKRYESRKLYDTEESRYVSLEDLAQWVREGQEIKVIDNASSDDVTSQILTQVILDEGKRGTSFLPTELLHELVRAGERAFHSGVEQVQTKVDTLVQRSIDRLAPVRQAREEMALLRERLVDLEKTLISLDEVTVPVGSPSQAKKAKAAPKRAAKKPAVSKPVAAKSGTAEKRTSTRAAAKTTKTAKTTKPRSTAKTA